ncbi:hypothetical protein Q5H93_15005 [Hymenobacter sp. ASUV-10]|uniref:Sel1 repeat family protein n=1 Tax=Hymenobacter aranciens TaxID=3063996 RepID=A0ABT9BCR1_9BACT|nr:hypothetical protein [Hymenobacter sp. ASUV-10]MDO7876051.1 hypothetical protein [Hymenobacter sp. ASUV-10]
MRILKSFSYSATGLLLAVGALHSNCSHRVAPGTSAASSVSQSQLLTPAGLRATILKETQPGGKLDFFTAIKGHEYDGKQLKPGVYATASEVALYQWGRAVNESGIRSLEEAYSIFSEFKGQPASARDKATIELGFNKKLDN